VSEKTIRNWIDADLVIQASPSRVLATRRRSLYRELTRGVDELLPELAKQLR
jgi:hypothetical protein